MLFDHLDAILFNHRIRQHLVRNPVQFLERLLPARAVIDRQVEIFPCRTSVIDGCPWLFNARRIV